MGKNSGKDKANGDRTIALNRRARHDYQLDQRFEAGMALQGWELKAIRAGRANITDAYAVVLHSELFLNSALALGSLWVFEWARRRDTPTILLAAALAGLLLSTRLYVGVVYAVYGAYAFRSDWARGAAFAGIALGVWAATWVPFAVWDPERFAAFGPFAVQGLYLPPWLALLSVLAALGLGIEALTAPVLFYLVVSVLTTGTFFMLTGMTDRARLPLFALREEVEPPPAPFYTAFGVAEIDPYGVDEEVGTALPAAMAFLGFIFVCCVMLVAGLPPLPGFVAKFALLSTALGFAEGNGAIWGLAAGILVSGFAAVFATTRIGMRLFWTTVGRRTPRLRILEALPVASLVLLTLGISAASGSVMTYFEAAADSLHDPQAYIRAVLSPQEGVEPGGRAP